ncbi:Plug domain-containing protein [Endozoicomonas gorgoniicola]|uniref:Plug domain-containing protein n=1 Tax=Endozoicomonas gorgoniicola TaxID=1234144 RepID=A0ABT3MSW1_9GAMM|nr:Plug domain-containing protein [Endozoicomonas gorgoniicola]MCW7552471.1 Plug domain-containing protein [Endozoicomonas gorgoniicola]
MLIHKTTLALAVSAIVTQSAMADGTSSANSESQNQNNKDVVVVVRDKADDQLTSKTTLDSEAIANTPSGNGNLTDFLKSNPSVRFDSKSENGFLGGEIRPSDISINGADPEQTAFMINGMSVNNDIDPTNTLNLDSNGVMPGKSSGQGYFLDANMLGSITVYGANIPASLGGFTGGVVDAEPLSYSGVNSTSVRYRTTGSSWASMKVDKNYDRAKKTQPEKYTSQFQPDYPAGIDR